MEFIFNKLMRSDKMSEDEMMGFIISMRYSGSTAHVDIAVATWASCLVGKKTFWLRNPSMKDDFVWSKFDVDSDHRLFFQPWARIDLYPGSIL